MTNRASPIRIDLPILPSKQPEASIEHLYHAVHNLHIGITGNPTTVNAACTDLATAVALLNQIRAALVEKGILV